MMIKDEKVKFVNELKSELKGYKLYGIMPLNGVPDTLFQKVKNQLKPNAKIVVARKTLLLKIMEGNENTKILEKYVDGNVALVLSKETDPFELYHIIDSNRLKLSAKPGQISPSDIVIEAGETSIPPGQAVTELKAGGIDVKIDKGKVVISKTKVLVAKGNKIATPVAKALKTLNITPFETGTKIAAITSGGILFTEQVLGINAQVVTKDLTTAFYGAYALTLDIGYVTSQNAKELLKRGYLSALGVGLKTKTYTPQTIEQLLAEAIAGALSIELAKSEAPKEGAANSSEEKKEEEEKKDEEKKE